MRIPRPEPAPLPSGARKAFEGVLFDVYQWEQPLYDGSTATFERLKRDDTVLVVPVTERGTILITEQEQPDRSAFVSFAGGRIDPGEEPEAAARRELLEETGYAAGELVLLEAVQPISKLDWAVYTFIARGCRRAAEQALDAGERIRVREIGFEEFLELACQEDFREVQVALAVLRARLDPEKMAKLRRLFFDS